MPDDIPSGFEKRSDSDHLVVRMLEDISSKLDRNDQRFDRQEKKFELMQFHIMDALELASMARLQAQSARERLELMEDRQRRFENGIADLSRRLAVLEGKQVP